ncbi:unnamed protein product [Urochloa humidicola]
MGHTPCTGEDKAPPQKYSYPLPHPISPDAEERRERKACRRRERGCAGEEVAYRPQAHARMLLLLPTVDQMRWQKKCWAGADGGPEAGSTMSQRRRWRRGSGRTGAGSDHPGRISAAGPATTARISAHCVVGGGWLNQRRRAASRPHLLRSSSALVSPRAGCPFFGQAPLSPRLGTGTGAGAGRAHGGIAGPPHLPLMGNREKRVASNPAASAPRDRMDCSSRAPLYRVQKE